MTSLARTFSYPWTQAGRPGAVLGLASLFFSAGAAGLIGLIATAALMLLLKIFGFGFLISPLDIAKSAFVGVILVLWLRAPVSLLIASYQNKHFDLGIFPWVSPMLLATYGWPFAAALEQYLMAHSAMIDHRLTHSPALFIAGPYLLSLVVLTNLRAAYLKMSQRKAKDVRVAPPSFSRADRNVGALERLRKSPPAGLDPEQRKLSDHLFNTYLRSPEAEMAEQREGMVLTADPADEPTEQEIHEALTAFDDEATSETKSAREIEPLPENRGALPELHLGPFDVLKPPTG